MAAGTHEVLEQFLGRRATLGEIDSDVSLPSPGHQGVQPIEQGQGSLGTDLLLARVHRLPGGEALRLEPGALPGAARSALSVIEPVDLHTFLR